MRLLIAPNFPNPYDQRMVEGLADGFKAIGHEAVALASPLPPDVMVGLASRSGVDVVMQVNRFRPTDPPLPSAIRHISWFQDVFPDTGTGLHEGAREGDIVYALGDAEILGLRVKLPCFCGSLVTGVPPDMLKMPNAPPDEAVDFSLCGFIPPPLILNPNLKADLVWYANDLVGRVPVLGTSWTSRRLRSRILRRYLPSGELPFALASTLRATAEILYRPLRGNLDITVLANALYAEAQPYVRRGRRIPLAQHWTRRGRLGRILAPYRSTKAYASSALDDFISYLSREHPRLLDRLLLIRSALAVSDSLELYGPGWDRHEPFKTYHHGIVLDPRGLLPIFRRSRINLANNTHGLGLHSRTLECMAAGGFVFTHTSPHDDRPGGMLTSFEPGVHYGSFTPESFADEARRWLADEDGRVAAGARAASLIREKHMWHHRAQQIVDDLRR